MAYGITYHSNHFSWSTVWAKINRQFYRLGYIRAARELERLGYHKEAKSCIKELNKL